MNQRLFEELIKEEQHPFSGWDFSYLEDSQRMVEFPLQWKFSNVLRPYLNECNCLLDMGTGGGEYLSSFAPLPQKTMATEGYQPNVSIARKRLEPLGVEVVPIQSDDELPFEDESFDLIMKKTMATEGYQPNVSIARKRLEPLGVEVVPIQSDDELPFEDESFDLIMNKHESFEASEVARLLCENGYFITQQVGGLNDCELNLWLNAEPCHYSNWSLRSAINSLREVGLTIVEAKDDISRTRFYDVGAIVYYLKAISWQIPDFSVETYFDRLAAIQDIINQQGYIDLTKHRFLIIAQKVKQD